MTTPGTGLRVSDKDFSDINTAFGDDFNAFSPAKTFAAVGSTITNVTFQVAGASTPAVVAGFGVVFSDVDNATSAKHRGVRQGGEDARYVLRSGSEQRRAGCRSWASSSVRRSSHACG